MREALLFFISLFSIVNPFATIPAFLGVTEGASASVRRGVARHAAQAMFVILLGAYAAGGALLGFFGISVASLRVAGGLLILSMAWSMLQARMSPAKQTPEEAEEAQHVTLEERQVAVVPLAMPLMAGPGAISIMIITAGQVDSLNGHLGVAAATLAVSVLAWLILLVADPIARALGRTGMNVATRFMGLILAAIAVEFITTGLSTLFPGWTRTGP